MTVTLERHPIETGPGWTARVTVPRSHTPPEKPVEVDEYGGYGATPLDAVEDLASTLADVVGYERVNGHRQVDYPTKES